MNKINHKAIKEKIDRLPNTCPEGKKAVAELLKELGYVEPKEVIPDIKPGHVYISRNLKLENINYNIYMYLLSNLALVSKVEKDEEQDEFYVYSRVIEDSTSYDDSDTAEEFLERHRLFATSLVKALARVKNMIERKITKIADM